jgi:hypothetical protein
VAYLLKVRTAEPEKQPLVAIIPAHNSRGIVTIRDVTRIVVAM